MIFAGSGSVCTDLLGINAQGCGNLVQMRIFNVGTNETKLTQMSQGFQTVRQTIHALSERRVLLGLLLFVVLIRRCTQSQIDYFEFGIELQYFAEAQADKISFFGPHRGGKRELSKVHERRIATKVWQHQTNRACVQRPIGRRGTLQAAGKLRLFKSPQRIRAEKFQESPFVGWNGQTISLLGKDAVAHRQSATWNGLLFGIFIPTSLLEP
mmetsp:Transcript_15366/g.35168  ORF Transcript_15366/g.35168 Transcript_15366/m.35168 type:complete len:211 (+) Transcript_15366:208-840(+)